MRITAVCFLADHTVIDNFEIEGDSGSWVVSLDRKMHLHGDAVTLRSLAQRILDEVPAPEVEAGRVGIDLGYGGEPCGDLDAEQATTPEPCPTCGWVA